MTTKEMLWFCGSVLGPALIAQAVAELMGELSRGAAGARAPASSRPSADEVAERLLRKAFPDGLAL